MQPMDSPMAGVFPNMLGILGILREAFKVTWKNKKFLLSITLLVLPPFTMLSMVNNFLVKTLMLVVASIEAILSSEDNDQSRTEHAFVGIRRDFRVLLGLELCSLIALWMVTLVAMMATVYSSAMAYVGKELTPKGMLLRIKRSLKRPAITWFYVYLFTIAYFVSNVVLIWVALPGVGAFIIPAALVGFFTAALYLYLAAVWTLGLIISIVEDDCYGLAALSKAGELIRGRKVQGFVLMLLLTVIAVALYLVQGFIPFAFCLVIDLMVISLLLLVKLFALLVYTVFYYECKKSHGEKLEMHGMAPVISNV